MTAAPPAGVPRPPIGDGQPLAGFIGKTVDITEFEPRKLWHDFTELITGAV